MFVARQTLGDVANFSEIRGQILRHYGGEVVTLFFSDRTHENFGFRRGKMNISDI